VYAKWTVSSEVLSNHRVGIKSSPSGGIPRFQTAVTWVSESIVTVSASAPPYETLATYPVVKKLDPVNTTVLLTELSIAVNSGKAPVEICS
jgi:hypothetical protein